MILQFLFALGQAKILIVIVEGTSTIVIVSEAVGILYQTGILLAHVVVTCSTISAYIILFLPLLQRDCLFC